MVTVGLSSVVMDKHGASKDNNSAAGANSELNTSSDSSSSSSGPLVEFSSSQSSAKEARSVKFFKCERFTWSLSPLWLASCAVTVCDTRNWDRGHWKRGGGISTLRCQLQSNFKNLLLFILIQDQCIYYIVIENHINHIFSVCNVCSVNVFSFVGQRVGVGVMIRPSSNKPGSSNPQYIIQNPLIHSTS